MRVPLIFKSYKMVKIAPSATEIYKLASKLSGQTKEQFISLK